MLKDANQHPQDEDFNFTMNDITLGRPKNQSVTQDFRWLLVIPFLQRASAETNH